VLGGAIHFVADQPAVLRVFDVMQLTRRLHVTPSVAAVDVCCPGSEPAPVADIRTLSY
jgi:hypothetical protein